MQKSKQNSSISEVLKYATITAEILRDFTQATHIPFAHDAAETSLRVLGEINGMKTNQGMLLRIVELIHRLLCLVVHMCLAQQGGLPMTVSDYIGHLVKTLQKIHTSVQLQQELGKIQRLIRQHEIGVQLRIYEVELQTILDDFKMRNDVSRATDLVELELDAQQRHRELMAFLAAQEDRSSLESPVSFQESISSSIVSVLPPIPKIMHGRNSELIQIVNILQIQPAYSAILGPGGMGKTTLAVAALHDPKIISIYEHRHFISCESAFQKSRLVNIIAAHLGLEPSKHLSKAIISHLSNCGPTLLVVDNLETLWEEAESRAEVEELLSLLSEVRQLSLLITMRGAERPAKIKWTRPFLAPLEPLDPSASRQTFIEIADVPAREEESDLEELLKLSGNLPLAVCLMAAVASHEGYSNTLRRWKIENIALLSDGHDKRSNLETSITLSLSSPRLYVPNAKNLLILLSFLPDGLSEVDMLSQEALDIPNVLKCRTALLRTSLAYMEQGRLKALSPVRQYMKRGYPPPLDGLERLRRHWDGLLTLWKSHRELSSSCELALRLIQNLSNINSVFQVALSRRLSGEEKNRLMHSILSLDLFSQNVLKDKSPLAQLVIDHIQSSGDRRLHWEHICCCLDVADYYNLTPSQADVLIQEGIYYYEQERDPSARFEFYKVAARYHYLSGNLPKALQFNKLGTTATEKQHIREKLEAIKSTVDLRRTSIMHSVSGQDLAEKQATSYWTIARLRHASDLCKLGRDILATYGQESSSREVNMLDIEAGVKFEKSEYEEARMLYQGVVRMTDHDRHPYFHANSLLNLVKIDQTMGRDEAYILRGLAVARQAVERLNWRQGMLFCERVMAGVYLARGDIAAAREEYARCYQACRRAFMLPGVTQCLEMLGDFRYGMSDFQSTFHWAGVYLAVVRVYSDVVPTYQALRCLGDIFLAEGDTETALNIFYAVLKGVTEMDIHRRRADCMVRIGDILMARGNAREARKMWHDAHSLFIRSSQRKDAASIDVRLAQFVDG
ncbi:NB-ARC domain-containing protein [Mycena venus]|uniref:NB-ARC domain-containing protein n=1 Tax=Mycena venus TaxID=2733690 RepID=A0A8H6XYL3_9AGAR|nr:NB-ARC domain-containing protein [Mycena venus]